jgi:hypothetical protein
MCKKDYKRRKENMETKLGHDALRVQGRPVRRARQITNESRRRDRIRLRKTETKEGKREDE